MALDVLIGGSNLDSNSRVKVELGSAGSSGVRIFSENDAGTVTGSALLRSPESSPDYRLRTGVDTEIFRDTFNASAQNTNTWAYTFATMTAAQPGAGTVNFSAVQGTTSSHGAFMRTWQYFPLINTGPLAIEFVGGVFTAALVAGEVWLSGVGLPSAAITRPTDGVWWKLTSSGLVGVLAHNGTETETGVLYDAANITLGTMHKYTIVIGERDVEWWMDDVLLTSTAIPSANGIPMIAPSAPVFMQKYNTGAVSNTNTIRVSRVGVTLMDIETDRAWPHSRSIAGQSCHVGQNGHTMGTTQAVGTITSGSTPQAPTAAAGSNTAANAVGLGGWGSITASVGAATDFIATSYQNPAATINITGRNLVITGVRVSAINYGAAVATTPTTLLWSLAYGHNTVTMATSESGSFTTATAHAPRRVQLGFMSAPVGAAVGAPYTPDSISFDFAAPIVVRPGEFLATIVKVIVGTATASQAIVYNVLFNGYFE